MPEYTVTEALQQLKLITKKIQKLIDSTRFISTKTSDDKSNQNPVGDSVSNFQAINDLIARRTKIKSAIMVSNATTTVEIAGKQYTVAEVIAQKEFIAENTRLLDVLKRQYASAQDTVVRYNNARQAKIDGLIQTTFGREANNKASVDDIKNITEVYQKQYYIDVLDPLNTQVQIEKLEKEIDEFKSTCDYKLSYINAVTKINVE